jgi:hypothetical protein
VPACTTTAQQLETDPAGLLAQDASNLYFMKGSAFWRVSKAGGPTTKIGDVGGDVPGALLPFRIAVDGAYLYFTFEYAGPPGGGIARMPLSGGPATKLIDRSSINFYGNLVFANHTIFWGEAVGAVGKMPVDGGPVTLVKASDSDPPAVHLAIGGSYVYWTTAIPNGDPASKTLMRAPLDGTTAEKVTDVWAPDTLASNSKSVIFEAVAGEAVLPFGSSTPAAVLALQNVGAIVADESNAYANVGGTAIVRAALDGSGTPTHLFDENPGTILQVLVDEQCVYWTDAAKGVMTIRK